MERSFKRRTGRYQKNLKELEIKGRDGTVQALLKESII